MADVFKYEVAMGTAAKIGSVLKKRQHELDRRIVQHRGAHEAGLVLSKKMQEYQLLIKKEVEDEDLAPEIHKRMARHVTNCALHAEKYAADQVRQIEHLRGTLAGIDEAVLLVDQIFKVEEIGMQRVIDAEKEAAEQDLLEEELVSSKNNGASKEATPDEIRELMGKEDKAGLIKLAVKAGVSSQGSKATIAKRILER